MQGSLQLVAGLGQIGASLTRPKRKSRSLYPQPTRTAAYDADQAIHTHATSCQWMECWLVTGEIPARKPIAGPGTSARGQSRDVPVHEIGLRNVEIIGCSEGAVDELDCQSRWQYMPMRLSIHPDIQANE